MATAWLAGLILRIAAFPGLVILATLGFRDQSCVRQICDVCEVRKLRCSIALNQLRYARVSAKYVPPIRAASRDHAAASGAQTIESEGASIHLHQWTETRAAYRPKCRSCVRTADIRSSALAAVYPGTVAASPSYLENRARTPGPTEIDYLILQVRHGDAPEARLGVSPIVI